MINLRNTVLAMTMGLFATGALAQGFIQDSETARVAEELFGGGSVKLEFGRAGFEPKAKLIFGGDMNASTDITMGTEFDVTLTLGNATFAEPVSNADFMWGTWGPATGARIETRTADNGGPCIVEGAARVGVAQAEDLARRSFCPRGGRSQHRAGRRWQEYELGVVHNHGW